MAEFTDGFETGDISAWDGNTGAAPAIVESPVHHGTYALECDGNTEGVYKGITSRAEYYGRVYVRMATAPSSGSACYLWQFGNGSTVQIRLRIYNDSGTLKWSVYSRISSGAYETVHIASPNPTTDTWYCTELRYDQAAASGAQLWVNGDLLWTTSDTTVNLATTDVRIYVAYMGGDMYFDCVEVDTSRVGCEAAGGLSIPVAMHHYNRINHIIRG